MSPTTTTVTRTAGELFVDPDVALETRPDGSRRFRSRAPLPQFARCVGQWLDDWARIDPQRIFLAQRGADGRWVRLSYGQARDRVVRIGTWLLGQRISSTSTFSAFPSPK